MSLHNVQMVLFIAAGIALVLVAAIVVVTVLAGIVRGPSHDDGTDRPRRGREQQPQ